MERLFPLTIGHPKAIVILAVLNCVLFAAYTASILLTARAVL